MSDREFENYLTLLAGLLRLDGKQRRAIADELRSHLEDRLEELLERGVSKDEAVQQASPNSATRRVWRGSLWQSLERESEGG